MSATRNRHVDRYLEELREALGDLPRRQRDELVAELEEHIAETVPPQATDAEVLTALDRIGDPEQIAAAERERLGVAEVTSGWLEWLAIALLLVGGLIIPLVGWVIGVIFLWLSRCWSAKDKVLATLLVPGGLAAPFILFAMPIEMQACSSGSITNSAGQTVVVKTTCTGGPSTVEQILGIAVLLFLVLAPVYTAVRLARRLPPRGAPGRSRVSLPRRQSIALFTAGLVLGAVAVWFYLR